MGGSPFVAVWDTRCPAEGALRTIELDSGARGVLALAFSPDGDTLAMVCADNQHTVYVWEWKKGKLLAEAKGATGEPPQVHPPHTSHRPARAFRREPRGQLRNGELTNEQCAQARSVV